MIEQNNKPYLVDEEGVIHRDGVTVPAFKKATEDLLYEEYNKLVYDLSHPERFSPEEYKSKQKRRAEIEQGGYDFLKNDVNLDAFKTGKSEGLPLDLVANFKQRNGVKK
ncbi:MAG: hypothetical protein II179_02390 [Alphaproteobacteria bacterium]|nr:hypothetical protein [Alphaproteobacteria bacterium]